MTRHKKNEYQWYLLLICRTVEGLSSYDLRTQMSKEAHMNGSTYFVHRCISIGQVHRLVPTERLDPLRSTSLSVLS